MITQDANQQLTPAVQTYLLLRDAVEVDLGVSVAEIEMSAAYWGQTTFCKSFQLQPVGDGRFIGRELMTGESLTGLCLKLVVIRENHYDWDRRERVESLKFGGFFTLYTDAAHGLKSPKATSMECGLKMDNLELQVTNPQLDKLRDLSLRLGLASGLRTFAKHLEEEVSDQWL